MRPLAVTDRNCFLARPLVLGATRVSAGSKKIITSGHTAVSFRKAVFIVLSFQLNCRVPVFFNTFKPEPPHLRPVKLTAAPIAPTAGKMTVLLGI
jgi:hypothetical protein